MKFQYGIEHEVAFVDSTNNYVDYLNTSFDDLDRIIKTLPKYDSDYPMLRVGDAGIKVKRWYIEGFERFSDKGVVTDCSPKGIEIRTTIHRTIDDAVEELEASFGQLHDAAMPFGYRPALISYHPWHEAFEPAPPLSDFEQLRRQSSPEKRTANIPMVTHGPDLSLSCDDFSLDDAIYAARKLTAYSPYIIPFSFSSPFYAGEPWEGLSVRTFKRTGDRPAVMVFIDDQKKMLNTIPSLTQMARIPAEVGRIEFKAFDSCGDFRLYAALFSLLKGIVLDEGRLPLSTDFPDIKLHRHSAKYGFHDKVIREQAYVVLNAAYNALSDDEDRCHLDYLFTVLDRKIMPAEQMKQAFFQGVAIEDIMLKQYLPENIGISL